MADSHRIAMVARVTFVLALLVFAVVPTMGAAPGRDALDGDGRNQSPDWLSAESAATLDVGFSVLLPSFVPAPFGGEPSISAYAGYYRLYWFIPGTPPTFLQITGEVGGFIPAYSEYDRNNQIFVNASVQGYEAYHDLTPIYDRVYWQAGDIVYTVDSRGLTGTDSLSLANSLIALAPPAAVEGPEVPPADDGAGDEGAPDDGVAPSLSVPASVPAGDTAAIVVGGVDGAMLTADAGVFPASGADSLTDLGAATVAWQAPATESGFNVFFILLDPSNGDWLATGETVVAVNPAPAPETEDEAPASQQDVPSRQTNEGETMDPTAEPTSTPRPLSDGTGAGLVGVQVAKIGDGTGGAVSDDETEPDSNIQEEQPGDLTGIGTEATQEALPTETDGGDEGGDDEEDGEADEPDSPTRTPQASPTAEATSTPGPSPTATLAPTTGLNGLVSRVIGPEGGELASPAGATLTIPAGALTEDATVTIVPVADTKLPVVSDVDFVPGSAFDVTVATATGQSVEQLEQSATLRVDVPTEQWRDGMMLYRIVGMEATPLDGATLDEAGVAAETDHFSRFAAGIAIESEADGRDPLPFIIAALGILAALLLIVGYVTAQQRRRPRAITPRSRRFR